MRYLKNYIKLPILLFIFLIFKDFFSEYELQTKDKRLLLKSYKLKVIKLVLNKKGSLLHSFKLLPQKILFQNCFLQKQPDSCS